MTKTVSNIRAHATTKPVVRIVNSSKDKTSAEMELYGTIGSSYWDEGITDKMVSDTLKNLDPAVKNLTVRINSGGGDVFQGVAIYNRLKQHKAKVTIIVDALAASIASIIMLAGDEIILSEGSFVMIHLPWTWAMGNRNDIENTVDRLRDIEEVLLNLYAKKTGLDRNALRGMLEEETWMGADEAIENGFATRKSDDEALPIAASVMQARWMKNAPRNFKSTNKVAARQILELKSKIGESLARK